MNNYLSELDDILPDNVEEYHQDLATKRACEKTIELAIEEVIAIISLIVNHQKLGLPHSEDDLIDLLDRKKIITSSLVLKTKEMKGFRNILVHRYGDIDDSRTFNSITAERDDFALFEREIKKYLHQVP